MIASLGRPIGSFLLQIGAARRMRASPRPLRRLSVGALSAIKPMLPVRVRQHRLDGRERTDAEPP